MRRQILQTFIFLSCTAIAFGQNGLVNTSQSLKAQMSSINLGDVAFTKGFFGRPL